MSSRSSLVLEIGSAEDPVISAYVLEITDARRQTDFGLVWDFFVWWRGRRS